MSFREVDKGMKGTPCFGMMCVPHTEGEVHLGMNLVVTETTASHEVVK